ncbi:hypothetical protein ACIBEA_44500 [Streptomyces sp. NPDC051555]|uniref:hypothetical protein n=1 Tax=Streptomyces sp. NPDC051555 TaxID=3365657 RepID=UPI003788934D
MPSVIALLECREARAREELESWLEAVREAEEHVVAARQRVDHARIAREEVLRALAEEGEGATRRAEDGPGTASGQSGEHDVPSGSVAGPVGTVTAVPVTVQQAVPAATGGGTDRDPRPPAWRAGLGEEVLSGVYRQVFAVAAAASGPVTVQELTRALGRDATRMNEVEKVRHRAYALEARGWLLRERGGVFRAAVGPAGGPAAPASAAAAAPSAGSA